MTEVSTCIMCFNLVGVLLFCPHPFIITNGTIFTILCQLPLCTTLDAIKITKSTQFTVLSLKLKAVWYSRYILLLLNIILFYYHLLYTREWKLGTLERTYMYFFVFYEQHSKLDPRNYTHSNGNYKISFLS